MRPQRLTTSGPKRDVGHKVPVHHVHVQQIGAGGFRRAHLLAQPAKSAERIEGAIG